MDRRTFLKTGSALPFIENAGIMDRDGQRWFRSENTDTYDAAFYLYGKMQVTTASLMKNSWKEAEIALRKDFEHLIVEMHRYWNAYDKKKLAGDRAGDEAR